MISSFIYVTTVIYQHIHKDAETLEFLQITLCKYLVTIVIKRGGEGCVMGGQFFQEKSENFWGRWKIT